MSDPDLPLSPGAAPATVDLPGRLILIVGLREGAGETPFDAARARLSGDPHWMFPRRVVTGPPNGRIGDIVVEEAAFLQVRARGGFGLSWTAEGRWYGLPAGIDADLARGARVVVAAARTVIAEARRRWPDVTVIETAEDGPAEVSLDETVERRRAVAALLSAVLAD